MRFVWVGVAGAVGSVLRYAVGLAFSGSRFPWATLSINIVGSLALGFVLSWGLGRWPVVVSTPVVVGLLGGFTTFSTFAWESTSMVGNGQTAMAIGYVLASLVGGLLAAAVGYALGGLLR
jgi:CrcB protein